MIDVSDIWYWCEAHESPVRHGFDRAGCRLVGPFATEAEARDFDAFRPRPASESLMSEVARRGSFGWEDDTPAEDAIFQALGAASTCWSRLDRAGVFDSERAEAIGAELVQFLKRKMWVEP